MIHQISNSLPPLQASVQGHVLATVSLGRRYETGQGVTQSFARAAEYYEKASDLGDQHAALNLGLLYDAGKGVEQSYARASTLFEKAAGTADGGLCDAQVRAV